MCVYIYRGVPMCVGAYIYASIHTHTEYIAYIYIYVCVPVSIYWKSFLWVSFLILPFGVYLGAHGSGNSHRSIHVYTCLNHYLTFSSLLEVSDTILGIWDHIIGNS